MHKGAERPVCAVDEARMCGKREGWKKRLSVGVQNVMCRDAGIEIGNVRLRKVSQGKEQIIAVAGVQNVPCACWAPIVGS